MCRVAPQGYRASYLGGLGVGVGFGVGDGGGGVPLPPSQNAVKLLPENITGVGVFPIESAGWMEGMLPNSIKKTANNKGILINGDDLILFIREPPKM
jgi:hypothetical protein